MANLVEAHAAAVKPCARAVPLADGRGRRGGAARRPRSRKASGDDGTARARPKRSPTRWRRPSRRRPSRRAEILDDEYLEIARSLERGMWVEFEGDDGQLAFAKLAWVSPLRGTYLFTNRQGQKALSMTAEELAERFRDDRARLVEAEPLIDRAFTSVMSELTDGSSRDRGGLSDASRAIAGANGGAHCRSCSPLASSASPRCPCLARRSCGRRFARRPWRSATGSSSICWAAPTTLRGGSASPPTSSRVLMFAALAIATALAAIAVLTMPVIVKTVAARHYPGPRRAARGYVRRQRA